MVLAVVDDLLFSSKIRSVAGAAGRPIVFVRKREDVLTGIREHKADVVLFDLDRASLDPVGAIRGIDVAMARSGFVTALPKIVAEASGVE